MKKKPQISIRTLLVLTALLAIAIGWLADRQRFKSQLREAAQWDLKQRQKMLAMAREIEQLKPRDVVKLPERQPAIEEYFPATH